MVLGWRIGLSTTWAKPNMETIQLGDNILQPKTRITAKPEGTTTYNRQRLSLCIHGRQNITHRSERRSLAAIAVSEIKRRADRRLRGAR